MKKIILLSIIGSIWSCNQIDPPRGELKRGDYPDLNYQDSIEVSQYDSAKLKWRLRAIKLERWPSKANQVNLLGVNLEMYDSLGQISAWLKADSVILFSDGNVIHAYGSTRIRSPKKLEVSSDSVWIDRYMNSVVTDAPVRILTPDGDLLMGFGLRSDLKLENWHIQKNVKAIFQNLSERIENAEKSSDHSSSASLSSISSQSSGGFPKIRPISPFKAPSRHPEMDGFSE